MTENDPTGLRLGKDEDAKSISNPNANIAPSQSSQVAEMDDLTARFSQQQVMISQLKEMVIAEEAARNQKLASSRLKMEKCVSQLARIRDRAKGSKLKNAAESTPVRQPQPAVPEPVSLDRVNPSASETILFPPQGIVSVSESLSTTSTVSTNVLQPASESKTKPKTPSREVTKMLHQQIKEHKAMIAERAKTEKELELALAKIQKQLEESQSQSAEILQIGQSKLKPTIPSVLDDNIESNKIINELKNRITQLEGTILDLQETCKEKDCVIDSKTKAITLMSADLSKKGKNTLDLLDDTKEQMQKMQENFASMESQMKAEKQQVLEELEVCKNRVIYLEEANAILESERFNLSIQNSSLEEKLAGKEVELSQLKAEITENLKNIVELNMKIDSSVQKSIDTEEKGTSEIAEMNALSEKIEILEKLNSSLRQTNIELEDKMKASQIQEKDQAVSVTKQTKLDSSKASKRGKSTSRTRGGQKSKNPNTKPEAPIKSVEEKDVQETIQHLEMVIQSLNKQVLEKEILLSQKEMENIESKEACDEKLPDNEGVLETSHISIDTDTTTESTTADISITPESVEPTSVESVESIKLDTSTIEKQLEEALEEIAKLSKELTEANKNMLKVKASHKAKMKQMQKSIDDFSKVSDSNSEVVRLQTEVALLTQKVAELEEDKGNLQLHLVDYDSGRVSDSELHTKLLEVENIADDRLKAIADLETQKFDLVQELHNMKQKTITLEDKVADLTFLENEHVSSELKSAQLEEQLDMLVAKNKEASDEIENLQTEKKVLLISIELLNKEKSEICNKLDLYIHENMDLIERLDKLSAEKVSSAESIEMVESLTSQEKMEIEQYQKSMESAHQDTTAMLQSELADESNRRDSFSNLNTENREHRTNMDLFNQEGTELLDKLDIPKNEGSVMSSELEELLEGKKILEEKYDNIKIEKDSLQHSLKDEESKNLILKNTVESLNAQVGNLSETVQKLMSEKSLRTEEVVISETVEIEDMTEKEYLQPSLLDSQTKPVSEVESKEATLELQSPSKTSKSPSDTKSNKNFTKEILRLKNLVKHQDAEIKDLTSQLSEAESLKLQIESLSNDKVSINDELRQLLQDNTILNSQSQSLRDEKESLNQRVMELEKCIGEMTQAQDSLSLLIQEKDTLIECLENNSRTNDINISELQNSNEEQKKSLEMLNNLIQSKNDEIAQCVHQINQLDSVSKKLKSTITTYEEEQSTSFQQGNMVKTLENNISQLKNKITENDDKIKRKETQLSESAESLEALNKQLDGYQTKINELTGMCEKSKNEVASINQEKEEIYKEITKLQKDCSEKDEEIHEIKLELRKESIEYDKMKNDYREIENERAALQIEVLQLKESLDLLKTSESKQLQEFGQLNKKYKEQYEKLKKFAANFKKKATLSIELEAQIVDLRKEINEQIDKNVELNETNQKLIQELSAVTSQYSQVKTEMQEANSCHKTQLEQQLRELQNQIIDMHTQYQNSQSQLELLTNSKEELLNKNTSLSSQVLEMESKEQQLSALNSSLVDKIAMYENEIENAKLEYTRISTLEQSLAEKQNELKLLEENFDEQKSSYNQFKCGQDAKIQEKEVYIESLESEILKHKDRISRLEDSVSTMEERRSSLERKTDHLVTKLHEKDAEYSKSSVHEDELIKRLTALIDHDEFIQKQLQEYQNENNDLLEKIDTLTESNKILKSEVDMAQSDVTKLQNEIANLRATGEEKTERILYLENELKSSSIQHSKILKIKSKEYEYLESELHSVISNAESQRRLSKEQFDKLQDEMLSQAHILKDLQSENDWLKSEHESLQSQKTEFEATTHQVTQNISESGDAYTRMKEYSLLLEEKDKEIAKLSIQLQFATPDNAVPNLSLDDSTNYIKELESTITSKNSEIDKLDIQFKSCLSQLSEAVESEKALKQMCAELTKDINGKDVVIEKLEKENYQLRNVSSTQGVKEIHEDVCQLKNIQSSSTKIAHKDKLQSIKIPDSAIIESLEDQIIPREKLQETSVLDAGNSMIRNFQHDPPEPIQANIKSYFESDALVQEETLQPKKAYICHAEEGNVGTMENVAINLDEEDGWGWTTQQEEIESHEIQAHIPSNMLEWNQNKIEELESRVQSLTEENVKLSAELTQTQQKTAKALLKLKEFKYKNDTLSKEIKSLRVSSDFNMLDMTIQDELTSQIKKLEDKIKESTLEINKEKLEKDGLLKRIDVLTSANERLLEMKERQDIEMKVCISQNKGLIEKLKNLEWETNEDDQTVDVPLKISDSNTIDAKLMKTIDELNKKINDLEADNEELQTFVDDQQIKLNSLKAVEIEFENLKSQRSSEMDENNKEIDILIETNSNLNEQINILNSQITQLNVKDQNISGITIENTDLKTQLEELKEKYNTVNAENITFKSQVSSFNEIKENNCLLQTKVGELDDAYNTCNSELQRLNTQLLQYVDIETENDNLKRRIIEMNQIYSDIEAIKNENIQLKGSFKNVELAQGENQQIHLENLDMKSKLEALVKEYYGFQEKYNDMSAEKDKIELEFGSLLKEKEKLEYMFKDISEQETSCKSELIKLSYENEELGEKYEKLLKKLNEKNSNELSDQTIKLTDHVNTLSNELDSKSTELITLNQKVEFYESEKISLEHKIFKLNEENTALLSNLAELRNNVTDAVDQRGTEIAEMWKQHLAMREAEFENLEQALRQEISQLESKSITTENLDLIKKDSIQLIQTPQSDPHCETREILNNTKSQLEEMVIEKDKYKNLYETEILSTLQKYDEIQQDFERQKQYSYEKEQEIRSLTDDLLNIKSLLAEEQVKDIKISEYECVVLAKEQELQEYTTQMRQFEESCKRKFYEYDVLVNNNESELDDARKQLHLLENKLSDTIHEHEAELADMRLKMHAEKTSYENKILELKDKADNLEVQLDSKINECKSLSLKMEELQILVDEEGAQMSGLRNALESQEYEIVTLKENLTEQTDAYEKLVISHMQQVYKQKPERHVTFSQDTKPEADDYDSRIPLPDSSSEKTPRADLDLALYMLHQRDVRCEELTVELMQLLEERDTLQLKLSNAIRANEELRSKRSPSLNITESNPIPRDVVKLKPDERVEAENNFRDSNKVEETPKVEILPTPSSSNAEVVERKSLETKLSQLHRVGHTKDIRLRDEREHRMRQMELLQRDVQHLPPEAAARLREAHYTLSRDTQSTSTVLLNWLWGKTTPKVVHM